MDGHRITMLGTGLIGDFYTNTLHGQRGRDRVRVAYSRSESRGAAFRERWDIPESTTDLAAAVTHPETDVVVVGLPNHLHEEAVGLAASAGKAVLCTKPLGRTADEARRMLETVERAGVFGGYLEDLCYTPKTLKAIRSVEAGAIGDVTWVRSRETHPGPHSAWFWDGRLTGGGAIVDLGCHGRPNLRRVKARDGFHAGLAEPHPVPQSVAPVSDGRNRSDARYHDSSTFHKPPRHTASCVSVFGWRCTK